MNSLQFPRSPPHSVSLRPLLRVSRSSRSRCRTSFHLLIAATLGASALLAACGEFLPLERSLFLLFAASGAAASTLLYMMATPARVAHPRLPVLAALLWAALLPLGLLAQYRVLAHSPAAKMHNAALAYKVMWLGTYAGTAALVALIGKLRLGPADTARRATPRPALPRAASPHRLVANLTASRLRHFHSPSIVL